MKKPLTSAISFVSIAVGILAMLPAQNVLAQSSPAIVWSTNGHSTYHAITDLGFSGDGSLLVSGSSDQTAKVWSVSGPNLIRNLSIAGPDVGTLLSVAISSDGTLVGAGDGGGQRRVWRVSTGQRLWITLQANDSIAFAVSFHPSTNVLASVRDYRVRLQNSLSGQGLLWADPTDRDTFDVRFSADGMYFASGNGDNTASLYGMPTEVPVGPIPQTTNTHIRDFVGHSQPVMSVAFSPDGKFLATTSGDGTARLWNTTNGEQVRVIAGGGGTGVPISINEGVGRVRFSADGKTLLTSSNGTLRFWTVTDGKLILTYTNVGNGVFAVSPDGKHFAYGTGCSGSFCSIPNTNAAVVLARMPLFITEAAVRTNAFQLEWQGGTGLYHVEQSSDVVSSSWQVVAGPFTNTGLSVPLTNGNRFFRVRDANNAP